MPYSPVSHWKDRVLFGHPDPTLRLETTILQWFLKSVSLKMELQIIAASVHGLLQLFALLMAALKIPRMLTLFRRDTEHTNMREWSLTACKCFYWLEAYFCRCHFWGKKKYLNETLKHAKYCREACQWSIYRLKKHKNPDSEFTKHYFLHLRFVLIVLLRNHFIPSSLIALFECWIGSLGSFIPWMKFFLWVK